MPLELNQELIHQFRDKVNQEEIFRELFRNVDGKNKWNIICSTMDWITVASEGLPTIDMNFEDHIGYNHLETINLMQYILCVDLIAESIIQLYRVLYNTTGYPLDNDREIFKQSKISDDKYFKHIRAVFSTHPVNLDSIDGMKSHTGERFYASWVAKDWTKEYDFYLLLYSNDPQKDEQYHLGVKIEDVNRYVEKRYKMLEILITKVDEILRDHKKYFKNKNIATEKDIIKQLEILGKENSARFGFRYGYSSLIRYLITMLSLKLTSDDCLETVIEYKEYLISFVPRIKEKLENMDDDILYLPLTATEYEFEKIYSYLNNHEHPLGCLYYEKLIEKGILPTYLINSNFEEKQLVLDAILHKDYLKKLKPITFKEFVN